VITVIVVSDEAHPAAAPNKVLAAAAVGVVAIIYDAIRLPVGHQRRRHPEKATYPDDNQMTRNPNLA
jgi:hypothetical protein